MVDTGPSPKKYTPICGETSQGDAYENKNRIQNKTEYDEAVGSRIQLDEPENLQPQFFKIENIFYYEGYYDYAGNYVNDIIIVILNKFIEFKSYIVCIQFSLKYDDKFVPP